MLDNISVTKVIAKKFERVKCESSLEEYHDASDGNISFDDDTLAIMFVFTDECGECDSSEWFINKEACNSDFDTIESIFPPELLIQEFPKKFTQNEILDKYSSFYLYKLSGLMGEITADKKFEMFKEYLKQYD